MAKSNLAKHITKKLPYKIFFGIMSMMSQSSLMGALPEIMAAVDPLVKGGEYFGLVDSRNGGVIL